MKIEDCFGEIVEVFRQKDGSVFRVIGTLRNEGFGNFMILNRDSMVSFGQPDINSISRNRQRIFIELR